MMMMIRMTLFGIGLVTLIPCAHAATDVIDSLLVDFTPSTLTKAAQRKELEWFRDAAKPFKGKKIMVVSRPSTPTNTNLKCLLKRLHA